MNWSARRIGLFIGPIVVGIFLVLLSFKVRKAGGKLQEVQERVAAKL